MEYRKKKNTEKLSFKSINEPYMAFGKENLTLEDTLQDYASYIEDEEIKVALEKIYSKMRDKDVYIINRRLQGATQNEIAKELNMSRSNVCRRIEKFQNELIKRGVIIL